MGKMFTWIDRRLISQQGGKGDTPLAGVGLHKVINVLYVNSKL